MIEKITNPKKLQNLNINELNEVAFEIRDIIISTVSKTGGHLGSSLGAVEICIALHYCLNLPKDSIIFDVGHQCYAHKIITGRKDMFSSLRTQGGLSGFPNPQESVYDSFISGHASTAVSWAQGMAEAKKLQNDKTKIVALIGDGSLTGGMCFEALNNCGHNQTNVLVVLNHNEMSISSSVGALSNYLNKIISMPIYNRIRKEMEAFLGRLPYFAKKLVSTTKKFEETIKGLVIPGIFFEELGFRYFGPLDGHNLEVLIPTLKNILSLDGPRLLHIITKKGKGYKLAEEKAEEFHGAAPFSVANGEFRKKSSETFGEVFAKKISSLGQKNKKIVAITAAMAKGTSLDIFQKAHPDRFFDVGIAEGHAVGLAAGLSRAGMRPYVVIYSTFLQRSFDQIIHDVALQKLPVVFCLDRAGFVGEDGPTHHGVFDIGYLRMIPDMICMAPKDKKELEGMVEFSSKLKLPSSIRYPKGSAYSLGTDEPIVLGKAQVLQEGKDVCIIALGSMVKEAVKAVKLLESKNIDVALINARFIKPLDEELFKSIAGKFKLIVTIEEGVMAGGFGSAILEFYERTGLMDKVKIKILSIPDEFSTFASREALFEIYGLDGKSIAEKINCIFKK